MGRTRKPCPCCKKVSRYRAADDVCSDCRRTFESAEKIVAAEKQKADMSRDVGLYKCRALDCWHWWPGYYYDLPMYIDSEAQDRFRSAMVQMTRLLVSEVDNSRLRCVEDRWKLPYIYGEKKYWDEGSTVFVEAPRPVAAVLAQLDAALRELIREISAAAFANGRNLLVSLAAGTTSIAEFEEEVAREAGKRER